MVASIMEDVSKIYMRDNKLSGNHNKIITSATKIWNFIHYMFSTWKNMSMYTEISNTST
jgi:hypothetical protein